VIFNNGAGAARNIVFSRPLPIQCWGIDKPGGIDESLFFTQSIPTLASGKELRYPAGQYGGLEFIIKDSYKLTANYTYRTPLRSKKKGLDTIILDIKHLRQMHSRNSVEMDLSDALLGRNSTIFKEINNSLKTINKTLVNIVKGADK
jgi:hypothetical protein